MPYSATFVYRSPVRGSVYLAAYPDRSLYRFAGTTEGGDWMLAYVGSAAGSLWYFSTPRICFRFFQRRVVSLRARLKGYDLGFTGATGREVWGPGGGPRLPPRDEAEAEEAEEAEAEDAEADEEKADEEDEAEEEDEEEEEEDAVAKSEAEAAGEAGRLRLPGAFASGEASSKVKELEYSSWKAGGGGETISYAPPRLSRRRRHPAGPSIGGEGRPRFALLRMPCTRSLTRDEMGFKPFS